MKKMKKNLSKIFVCIAFVALSACSKDDSPNPGSASGSLGTFAGNIQVSDDPQTKLGYIYNAKVTVTKSGNNATIKIKGDLNVDREYTGTVASSGNGNYYINISKQTKPSAKNATESLVINNNALAFMIGVSNDSETVKASPAATSSIVISGKIQLIGTGMIKE